VGNATEGAPGTFTFTSAALLDGTYAFTTVATDLAGNASVASAALNVTIDATNPSFTSGATATAQNEGTTGAVVYTATTTDANTVTYSEALDAGNMFTVAANGQVTLSGTPDYETATSYSVTVRATDLAGNVTDQVVAMAVNDVNDVAPTLTAGFTALSNGQVSFTVSDVDTVGTLSLVNGGFNGTTAVNDGTATTLTAQAKAGVSQYIVEVTDSVNATLVVGNIVEGSTGADTINPPANNEDTVVYGFAGNDTITTGSGDDIIFGGAGADDITGGAGNDTIDLGAAGDADTIIYTSGTDGLDTITNFVNAEDKYDTSFVTTAGNFTFQSQAVDFNGTTVVSFDTAANGVQDVTAPWDGFDLTDIAVVLDKIDDNSSIAISNAGDDFLLVVQNASGGQRAVYQVSETSGDAFITTADTITLVGLFDLNTTLANGDII
ncbi:MAG: hypothetical protein JXK16_06190, partial [Thiotrichales bacterium]|nr:hypothetical protein [Thiotrichales bacterium]